MFFASLYIDLGLHKWLGGKEFTCNAGDMGLRPGSGTSPGEGNGYPLQYSCLENPTTEEAGRQQSKGSQRNGQDLVMRQQWHVVCSPSHHWRQLGASLGLEPGWPGPCLASLHWVCDHWQYAPREKQKPPVLRLNLKVQEYHSTAFVWSKESIGPAGGKGEMDFIFWLKAV